MDFETVLSSTGERRVHVLILVTELDGLNGLWEFNEAVTNSEEVDSSDEGLWADLPGEEKESEHLMDKALDFGGLRFS